ncbi:Gfo/Idh/MocA family oxidoreductase [Planctomycetota bacterium]|nr:Gfo/Idh/MocA family oxidoreductase [Planctomycetota bacterium]
MGAKKTKQLRTAFIGSGGIANTYLGCIKRIDELDVVALSDISMETMLKRAEEHEIGNDALFTDYKQMLREAQPDVVFVCTPNGLHCPASIAASKAGAHVMVEKPMAMNAREGKRMIEAAKKANKKLIVGYQWRFDPKTQFIKKQVDSGVLGDVLFGKVWALRRRGIPNWGVFGRKELQGGGPMIDIGVHSLEMCHYAMGSPKPVSAMGMTWTYLGDKPSDQIESHWKGWDYKTYNVEDLAVGHIRFDNGAVIQIESSFAAHIPENRIDFQLMGTKGGCTWNDSKIFKDENGYMVNSEPGYLPASDFVENFYLKIRNFVDHINYGIKPVAPIEDGLMVQQMLDAIYKSAEQGGKEIKIK